ncbi:MAG: cell surface protein [Myxococcota bacterium]
MRAGILLTTLLFACGPQPETGTTPEDAGSSSRDAGAQGPYVVEVVEVHYGEGAGFGQSRMPNVVLGPPQGGGEYRGSLDVVSLGVGGSITVRLGSDVVDGDGADFVVFENAFRVTGSQDFYREPGEVAVSEDGVTFTTFPCDVTAPYPGCAGVNPVYAPGPDGGISPVDVAQAGGDAFDLSSINISRARFVRITDRSTDPGTSNQAGFDLDAVAVIHVATEP